MNRPEQEIGKLQHLRTWFRDRGPVLVAFSAGVDSTFLSAVAAQELGPQAEAVTAVSPSLPRREVEQARALAQAIGIRHRLIHTQELNNPAYTTNPPNRCYYCKTELYRHLRRLAADIHATVVDGTNLDDAGDIRPGRQAAEELGVVSPLLAFGFTKSEIRTASRALGLPTADKLSSPCLASRFAFGVPISAPRLREVDQAETKLHAMGFRVVRVRVHDDLARIEFGADEVERALDPARRAAIVRTVKDSGFRFVALDLEGYRQGSLHRPGQAQ